MSQPTSPRSDSTPPIESMPDPFTGISGTGPITEVGSEVHHDKGRWDTAFKWIAFVLLAIGLLMLLIVFLPRGS